jgi:hypothetical protein
MLRIVHARFGEDAHTILGHGIENALYLVFAEGLCQVQAGTDSAEFRRNGLDI